MNVPATGYVLPLSELPDTRTLTPDPTFLFPASLGFTTHTSLHIVLLDNVSTGRGEHHIASVALAFEGPIVRKCRKLNES